MAQDYNHSIKVRTGEGFGLSYKHLTGFEKGYEFTLLSTENYKSASAIRVFHTPAFPRTSDKWFLGYGYGVHVALYREYTRYNPFTPFTSSVQIKKPFVSPGLDGYVGLEYRFLKHPFTFSTDLNTNLEFFGVDFFRLNMFVTVGFAYVF